MKTLAQQTAEWLGFHDEAERPSRIRWRPPGKIRRYTTIGLGPTYIMTMACYGTVWKHEHTGKFVAVNQRDGTERVVDGVAGHV